MTAIAPDTAPMFFLGDRVRVRDGAADHYLQPWRDRFKKGRLGTVRSDVLETGRIRVEWDHRYGNPNHWRLDMHPGDLERVA